MTNKLEKITGKWFLKDINKIIKNKLTVFSCFHCGGGSSMGYKLAGFDVLGGVELDSDMMAIYKANFKPKYSYLMSIQEFNKISMEKIPKQLKELDILDGSPPCSSFSMAGKREKRWGNEYYFREGQAKQVLDDLFFHFIETGKRLKPKIILAENVKGLIMGKARGYVKEIFKEFDNAGYNVQLFLLNSCKMGVPQKRERTFFLARRKDLNLSEIKLKFDEKVILLGSAIKNVKNLGKINKIYSKNMISLWKKCNPGESFSKYHPKGHFFNYSVANPLKPARTITAGRAPFRWDIPRYLSENELKIVQSFPEDYDFLKIKPNYVMGMSVPPFMLQRIAFEIKKQWF